MDEQARLDFETFPSQGRVGRARSGPAAGQFIFVFPEIKGRWGFYVSDGADDILPSAEMAEEWLREARVEWLDEESDREVESRLFQLRPIVASQYDNPGGIWDRLRQWPSQDERMSLEEKIERWEQRLHEEHGD